MERLGLNLGRLMLALAAGAGVVYVVADSSGHPAILVAGATFLAATGALINRAWAAALPFGIVVALMLFDGLVNGTQNGGDLGWWGYFILFAMFAAAVSVCLLIGVAFRRTARRHNRLSPQ